jgi:hypothetical protein
MCKSKGRPVTRQYRHRSKVEVQTHSCLTSAIDGGRLSMPRPSQLTALTEPQDTYWIPNLSQIYVGIM